MLSVHDPFSGLNIKLTGPSRAYLLLVLPAWSFFHQAASPPKPAFEEWRIYGKVHPEDGATLNVAGPTISIRPPLFEFCTSSKKVDRRRPIYF